MVIKLLEQFRTDIVNMFYSNSVLAPVQFGLVSVQFYVTMKMVYSEALFYFNIIFWNLFYLP